MKAFSISSIRPFFSMLRKKNTYWGNKAFKSIQQVRTDTRYILHTSNNVPLLINSSLSQSINIQSDRHKASRATNLFNTFGESMKKCKICSTSWLPFVLSFLNLLTSVTKALATTNENTRASTSLPIQKGKGDVNKVQGHNVKLKLWTTFS